MKKSLLAAGMIFSISTMPIADKMVNAQTTEIGVQQIGEGAKIIKRTEDAFNKTLGITQNIQFDFVKDDKFNKDALIIKTQGHIQSRTQYRWLYNNPSSYTAQMIWPSKYHVNINTKDRNVNIVNFLPKNNIETIDVSQTTGYSIGGSFGSSLTGGINGSYNYSKSISYNQQNFKSEVKNQSSKSIGWDIIANEFQQNGERFKAEDKNALVHWYTYGETARDYFWEDPELPVLIKSGFNPSFITTVTREKDSNSDTSVFEVTYGRTLDITNAWRKTIDRISKSYLETYRQYEAFKNRSFTVKYEVNWKTHEIKIIK